MNKSGNERLIGNSFLSRFSLAMTGYENGTLGCEITPGLRVPGMALLGYRPFGPSPPRSAFPFRNVRHPSVHSSLAIAFGNQHGSQGCRDGGWGGGCRA